MKKEFSFADFIKYIRRIFSIRSRSRAKNFNPDEFCKETVALLWLCANTNNLAEF